MGSEDEGAKCAAFFHMRQDQWNAMLAREIKGSPTLTVPYLSKAAVALWPDPTKTDITSGSGETLPVLTSRKSSASNTRTEITNTGRSDNSEHETTIASSTVPSWQTNKIAARAVGVHQRP